MAKEKGVIVSFRVDQHLADVLNKVPDKSAFIRDVILRSFYETCPVCRGRGVLPEELARWARDTLGRDNTVECHCCHYGYPESIVNNQSSREGEFTCPHCADHDHAH